MRILTGDSRTLGVNGSLEIMKIFEDAIAIAE